MTQKAPPLEVKPPIVSTAPPSGRKFPCANCGARLDFDPAVRGLKCPYCGFTEVIQRDEKVEIPERDYQEYLDKEESKGKAIEGHTSQTRCPGCGAIVLLEDKVATDRCPFCTTHLETQPEVVSGMIAPESVLPFQVDLKAARNAFTTWLQGLWFAPSELKTVANLGQLNGVYLPYWTYDTMTYSFYEGQRGDDYTVTQTYAATLPDGRTEQRTRAVVQTRWSSVSGEVQNFFDDVLVCGSKSIPTERLDDLGNWSLPKLAPFNAGYLSGFHTERYAIGLRDGFAKAKVLMEPEIINLIRRDIGGDHQQIGTKRTRYSGITFKHLLLPVWVAVYRYHDKTFQVIVNGQTGRVSGVRPWSWLKISVLAAAILFAISVTIAIVMSQQ